MLIEDQEFNLSNFKKIYKKMKWIKSSRLSLGNKEDIFYIGTLNNKKTSIKIVVRPSMCMTISESFYGLMVDGSKPKQGYKGKVYEFGTTIEVKIDSAFLEKISKEIKKKKKETVQKVSWE